MLNRNEHFLSLLERDYERLERFALSVTRRRDEARELLAQSIASCLEGFDRLKDDAAFLSYAFSVISRTHARKRAFGVRQQSTDPQTMQELYDSGLAADDAFDLQLLYDAIDRLPEQYREIFVLAEIIELPHKEIAAMHNLSIATIKIRVFRAKKLLRSDLGIDLGSTKSDRKKNLLQNSDQHDKSSDTQDTHALSSDHISSALQMESPIAELPKR